jgi:uncharacterized membrane protein (GlpM family)
MKLRNALAALVATSLVSAPVVVQAASASVQNARAGSDVEGEELIGLGIIPLLAIFAAVAAAIAIAADDDDEDLPTSP